MQPVEHDVGVSAVDLGDPLRCDAVLGEVPTRPVVEDQSAAESSQLRHIGGECIDLVGGAASVGHRALRDPEALVAHARQHKEGRSTATRSWPG